ncbi:hypothetical protein R1flu_018089 [Riccia fluitans]|uniref:Uncharacterized protein n=1 Tax=Riccia fluitans TaxID=41844 RepID=A0ABD1ZG80_9MARC
MQTELGPFRVRSSEEKARTSEVSCLAGPALMWTPENERGATRSKTIHFVVTPRASALAGSSRSACNHNSRVSWDSFLSTLTRRQTNLDSLLNIIKKREQSPRQRRGIETELQENWRNEFVRQRQMSEAASGNGPSGAPGSQQDCAIQMDGAGQFTGKNFESVKCVIMAGEDQPTFLAHPVIPFHPKTHEDDDPVKGKEQQQEVVGETSKQQQQQEEPDMV